MTNKLVVIINSLKVPKIKKILLYEMKFRVSNYSSLQNPWLGGYRPQIPVLSVLCPQLNLLNPPPPEQNSWVRHWHSGITLSVAAVPHGTVVHSLMLYDMWHRWNDTDYSTVTKCSQKTPCHFLALREFNIIAALPILGIFYEKSVLLSWPMF